MYEKRMNHIKKKEQRFKRKKKNERSRRKKQIKNIYVRITLKQYICMNQMNRDLKEKTDTK